IYGIWSPIAEGKICTHAVKWKMVRKAVDVQEAAADQGACAPWSSVNNCTEGGTRRRLKLELRSRGFDGSDEEIDILERGGG
ncbi:replication endonuclease, partial [Salmonella enterica subsp. enterica serovar Lubbock]